MRRIQKAPNPCNCGGNKIRSLAGAQDGRGGGLRAKQGKPRMPRGNYRAAHA